MSITKKAKKAVVTHEKYPTYGINTQYECPSCKVIFKGCGPRENVLRFKCVRCGQELIADHKHIIKHPIAKG